MNKKIVVAGLIALALAAGSTQAFANGGGGRKGGDPFSGAFFQEAHLPMRISN